MREVVGGGDAKRSEGSWIEARWQEGGAKLGQEGVWRLLPEIWSGHESVPEGS